ncbi:MAG: histidine kinase [Deinococcus-Thermus bacterium]|jgi:hypothetical protein|nr:histidine kinase [Deinococcota bacterium]
MRGKLAVLLIVGAAVLAGGLLFYLEQFHWYEVSEAGTGTIALTTPEGAVEEIAVTGLRLAEGDSSPLKWRACFQIGESPAALAARFAAHPAPEPTVAPLTFPCFEADAIASALAAGDAVALVGRENVTYGIDRVVAVGAGGTGHAWHQINRCGEVVFDGDPAPEGCPPPPAALSE